MFDLLENSLRKIGDLSRKGKLFPRLFPSTDDAEKILNILRPLEFTNIADDKKQAALEKLRTFPRETLIGVLPIARRGHRLLCEVVGWDAASPLVELIVQIASTQYSGGSLNSTDIPNSSDTASGVIDLKAVQSALQHAGEDLAREVCDLFEQSGENVKNTLTLIQAAADWNRESVLQRAQKYSQIAIKASGLLPLRDENDLLECYLMLKQSARDGQKFGQGRRITHAAAVQVALINLAQVAGYADASRLEWDMEARIAQELAPSGRTWTVGDYQVELVSDGMEAAIKVNRSGRALKSPSKEVRASLAYQEAKDAVAQLRAQVSRLRNGLIESLIASGEMLSQEEVLRLLRLPAARVMFQRLIWRTPDEQYGLLDVEQMRLCGLDGASYPLPTALGLAHPYHFYHAGTLAAWQREIVRRRIVQPVKQGFRELYLLTPAEQSTNTYSNRFAGHVVDGRIAARLFGNRGWRIQNDLGTAMPYKIFGDMCAVFDFPDAWHFLGRSVAVTTDRIYFEPYPAANRHWNERGDHWIPLAQVPPLVFSEVMRDADLVVSVAQRAGEAKLSNEAYQQRGQVITALLDDLGLPGVTIEGHFAHVQGKLARYRVHLGSAVIHIEPGNYLCIVPNRWGQKHESLFLPFADEGDAKISEVISKILLLLADDKIKDQSILRQIKRQV